MICELLYIAAMNADRIERYRLSFSGLYFSMRHRDRCGY